MGKRRSSRSPSADLSSASAATTSVADQRASTIRTARLLCRLVAVASLAQALREEEARADVTAALKAADLQILTANHACRILAIMFVGELSGWWMPTRLVGLQNFRNSPLFELMFSGAAKKLVWRAAYFVMSYFYRCGHASACMQPAARGPASLASLSQCVQQRRVDVHELRLRR